MKTNKQKVIKIGYVAFCAKMLKSMFAIFLQNYIVSVKWTPNQKITEGMELMNGTWLPTLKNDCIINDLVLIDKDALCKY